MAPEKSYMEINNVFDKEFVIKNRLGLHARAAAHFVRLAGNFDSEIFIEKDGQEVNGKSIMGVLILAAGCGAKIKLRAEGNDAEAAVTALGELVNRGFDEDD